MKQEKEMQLQDEVITKVHDVKYAPFKVLQQNDTFKIILGNSIVSERTFNNKVDAIKYINSKPYELITNLICITLELKEQYEKEMQEIRQLRKENEQNS